MGCQGAQRTQVHCARAKGIWRVMFQSLKDIFRRSKVTKVVVLSIMASLLSFVPTSASASTYSAVDSTNVAANATNVTSNGSLLIATKLAATAVAHTAEAVATGHEGARSTGLYYTSTSYATGVAQSAVVVAGGLLSIYANVTTTAAISTTSGIIYGGTAAGNVTKTSTATGTAFSIPVAQAGTATAIAVIFQAPSTAGTATISLSIARLTAATTPGTVAANHFLAGDEYSTITVTVLANTNLSTSHYSAGSSANHAVVSGPVNSSLLVATASNTGGAAVAPDMSAAPITGTASTSSARSSGLLAKDSTMGTAQTATLLTSGKLALYANVSTSVALTVSGGTLGSTTQGSSAGTVTYSDPTITTLVVLTAAQAALGATGVGTLWTAPSTAGTYTISMYYASNTSVPTLASPSSGVLGAQITVTVVAASSGGSFSAAYSGCVTKTVTTATSQTAATADSTSTRINGEAWYVGFFLRDAYVAYLADGNLVATVSGSDAVVNLAENGDGSALSAGTGATVVQYGNANAGLVRIDQATAGKPVTTTLTITYNGTTVCTKTLSIRGSASSIEVSNVATGDLSSSTSAAGWLDDPAGVGTSGARTGHYYVTLKDSAGNIVYPATGDTFSMDPATTTTTVTALTVAAANFATSTSSSSSYSKSVGTFTCGPTAGQSSVKLRHTTTATGVTITSPAFVARCADDPYTYTASWDKATYRQGEVATLTVKFLDSKGNPANSVVSPGASTFVTPMLTAVSATGSASMLTDANGVKTYTYTVGTTTGMTAGSYSSIIDFSALTAVAATKATPGYTLTTGDEDVEFAAVLKSIVALIASINKQIQALQKLILKR